MTSTTAPAATFTVGQTVSGRSLYDYDVVWHFTVIARTAKFVTLQDDHGKTYRVGIKVWDGEEYAMPFGNYSMALSVYASRS